MAAYDFTQANQNLGTAFSQAQNSVSARSRDTAAARVRARMANQNRGEITAIQNAGNRNMGLMNARLAAQGRANQAALATGLADVEKAYADNQLAAAQAMGNIATAQGGVQKSIGELGIGEKNAATSAEDVANRLRLGLGEQDIERAKLEETKQAARKKELLDWYNSFASTGATVSESPAFNARFNELITALFGAQGLTAAPADNVTSTVSAANPATSSAAALPGESYNDWITRISTQPGYGGNAGMGMGAR